MQHRAAVVVGVPDDEPWRGRNDSNNKTTHVRRRGVRVGWAVMEIQDTRKPQVASKHTHNKTKLRLPCVCACVLCACCVFSGCIRRLMNSLDGAGIVLQ